jgi:hypothetical protein
MDTKKPTPIFSLGQHKVSGHPPKFRLKKL